MIPSAPPRARLAEKKGFTLLEVMVALAIMAVLSLLTAQAIKSAIDNRAFVSSEIGRDAQLADTLRIIRSDIALAFHYQDIFCKMAQEATAQPTPGQLGQAPAPVPVPAPVQPAGSPKPCPPDLTGFLGESESLYFTSVSNVRTLRDAQESDQAKIGYYIKSCRTRGPKGVATKCLYRSIGTILDEELDKPGPETLLVENVEEFKLRYLGPGREEFVETWKTGKNGDDVTRENFPYAVEITLTLHDKSNPKDKPVTATVLAPLNFPNNPTKKNDQNAVGGANPASTPSPFGTGGK